MSQKQYIEKPVVQNFLLLAEETGLATHWKTPRFIKSDRVKKVLNVTENELVTDLIMVGYTDQKAKTKPRKSAKALTRFINK